MKKFIAGMLVMVILTMGLVGMAQAEEAMCPRNVRSWVYPAIDDSGEEHYYAMVVTNSEGSDGCYLVEIERDVYDVLVEEYEAGLEAYNGLWYVQTCRWCANAAEDALDWITFWN